MDALLFSSLSLFYVFNERRRNQQTKIVAADTASASDTADLPSLVPSLESSNSLQETSTKVPTTVAVAHSRLHRERCIPLLEAAGGTDKCPETGHRRDTLPIARALEEQGIVSQVLQYQEEFETSNVDSARANNGAIRSLLLGLDGEGTVAGVIVRVNPGM
jgi:hypothetical protein